MRIITGMLTMVMHDLPALTFYFASSSVFIAPVSTLSTSGATFDDVGPVS